MYTQQGKSGAAASFSKNENVQVPLSSTIDLVCKRRTTYDNLLGTNSLASDLNSCGSQRLAGSSIPGGKGSDIFNLPLAYNA